MLFFNIKRYIRANILNIKTKIKNINIINTLFKSGFSYKRKKEFILNFLNIYYPFFYRYLNYLLSILIIKITNLSKVFNLFYVIILSLTEFLKL